MVIPPVQALFVVEVVPIWVTVKVVVGVAVRTSLSQSCVGSMMVVVMAMVQDREDGDLSVGMVRIEDMEDRVDMVLRRVYEKMWTHLRMTSQP